MFVSSFNDTIRHFLSSFGPSSETGHRSGTGYSDWLVFEVPIRQCLLQSVIDWDALFVLQRCRYFGHGWLRSILGVWRHLARFLDQLVRGQDSVHRWLAEGLRHFRELGGVIWHRGQLRALLIHVVVLWVLDFGYWGGSGLRRKWDERLLGCGTHFFNFNFMKDL